MVILEYEVEVRNSTLEKGQTTIPQTEHWRNCDFGNLCYFDVLCWYLS